MILGGTERSYKTVGRAWACLFRALRDPLGNNSWNSIVELLDGVVQVAALAWNDLRDDDDRSILFGNKRSPI